MALSILQFAAAAVISYLGLLAGFSLAYFTREELPTGKKYFGWLQRLIILMAAAITMNFLGVSIALKLMVYAVLLLLIAIKLDIKLFYALFGIAAFAAAKSQNVLSAILSLVFLFGLVSGSQCFVKKDFAKNAALLLARNSAYFIAVLLYAFYG